MALMTSSTTELAHQYLTNYQKKLLPRAIQLTVLDQFSSKFPFPREAGAKTMRMFRQESAAASDMSSLSEGVPLTTYTEVGLDYVEATLVQYGMVVKISDVLNMTSLFSTLDMSRNKMAEAAALHADQIVRNVIIAGTTTNKLYAGGATSYATLTGLASAELGKLALQDLARAMTVLKLARAPKKNGEYFAIVDPRVAYDLMTDTKYWIPSETYQNKNELVKGEVGKWFNIRVVETTVPFRETATEGTFDAAGVVFSTVCVGSDAFGTPIMSGNSPYSPKVNVVDTPDHADPLNQTVLAGLKTYWAALMLNELWSVVIRSRTSFA